MNRLQKDDDSGDLQATAGGACTGTTEHESYQYHLGQRGPLIEVHCGETSCGDDG